MSNRAADALKFWLKTMFADIDVWMSQHDIEAGTPWATMLHEHLKNADFGILCMTRENLNAPWLLYEAGALTMSSKAGCVIPYLLGVESANLPAPLSHFQAAQGDKKGTWKIVKSINTIQTDKIAEEELRISFEEKWPTLARRLGLEIRTIYIKDALVITPSSNYLQVTDDGTVLREKISAHFRDGEKRIILDLSEATYLTSSCMPVFYSGLRARQHTKAELVLTNVDPGILELLKMTGIEALVKVFPTIEDALKAFKDESTPQERTDGPNQAL